MISRLSTAGAMLAALLTAQMSPAAQIQVSARLDPNRFTIGDRVNLKITFRAPADIRIEPAFSATQFAHWEVLGLKRSPVRTGSESVTERDFILTITAWSVTVTKTPRLPFRAVAARKGGAAWEKTIMAAPQKVKVESVLAKAKDRNDLRPLKGVIGFRSVLPYLLAGVLVLLATAAWLLWRARRRRQAAQAGPPPIPPEKAAREALEELLTSGLLERGLLKLFYTELGDIPRRYLENRFEIPALDRTTAELLPELRQHRTLRPLYPDMRDLLQNCDLVKFAKFAPEKDEIEADVSRVRRFVEGGARL